VREPESSKWLPPNPKKSATVPFIPASWAQQTPAKIPAVGAKTLATDIGAYHVDLDMDSVVTSLINLFSLITDFRPRFTVHSGSKTENLALQNIQARLRMVIATCSHNFFLLSASTATDGGSLRVLGSANVDECLRGYMTKYDNSSSDINPISGISKRT
jgi:NAD+ synthase (glutamine-hydrolysing)